MKITEGFKENKKGDRFLAILITDIKVKNLIQISNFEYHLLAKNSEIKVLATFKNDFAYTIRNKFSDRENNPEYKDGNVVLTLMPDGTYRLLIRTKVGKRRSFKLNRPSFCAEVIFKDSPPVVQKNDKRSKSRADLSKEQKMNMLKESYAAYEKKVLKGQFKKKPTTSLASEKKKVGIYQARYDKRSCNNCTNLVGNKCVIHQLNVKREESCRRFHPYKLEFGGGFSPR